LLEQPKQLSSHPGANMRWKRIALFLARYPQLYHVSLCSDSETVLRLGLLSAASVLDSVGASASLRKTLQQSQRKSVIHVSHPVHGALFLNDQLPLPASALVRCLIGITPAQWYEELNQRIFFWLSRSQAERFAAVRKTLLPPKTLFVLNTEKLLRGQAESFDLCAFNSGNAMRKPVPRSVASFQSLAVYPLAERARQRGWKRAAVELSIRRDHLTIRNAVEQIEAL